MVQPINAFLAAVANRDLDGARRVLEAEPAIAATSIHVAAVLGRVDDVGRLLDQDPDLIGAKAGPSAGDALLWLCYSPFHGLDPDQDDRLAATAAVLLDAGADPNTVDDEHGLPALFAVTGHNNAPRIARMLLEAGANPTDGESVFHAAERFHQEALALLLEYGVRLNGNGDWGNTPLYFLLRYWDVARMETVRSGFEWLLAHGADPDILCGEEQESSLHVAIRRGQDNAIVQRLIDHGASLELRNGRGRSPWLLAQRGGFQRLATLLEEHGASPEPLSPADALMAACGRGDADTARRLTSPELLRSLDPSDVARLPEAANAGHAAAVSACLAAAFPVDARDEIGATALHYASIRGDAATVRILLDHGADFRIEDGQHSSDALGWACFGADFVAQPDGDYEGTAEALLEAGARLSPDEHGPSHEGVRELLRRYEPS